MRPKQYSPYNFNVVGSRLLHRDNDLHVAAGVLLDVDDDGLVEFTKGDRVQAKAKAEVWCHLSS